MNDATEEIIAHLAFYQIEQKKPELKGALHVFNAAEMKQALDASQTVSDCKVKFKVYGPVVGNFFQMDCRKLSDSVPINRTNVNMLMQEKFENPEVARANYQPLVIGFQAGFMQVFWSHLIRTIPPQESLNW